MTTPAPIGRLGYILVERGNWGRVDLDAGSLFDDYAEIRTVCDEENAKATANGRRERWTIAEVLELEEPS